MKKSVKFLLPMLAVALLLGLSSISCASNVKGKTFKAEGADVTINFTTKSDFVMKEADVELAKGTYKVAKKKITCKYTFGGKSGEMKFDIINAKKLKDDHGGIWNKI